METEMKLARLDSYRVTLDENEKELFDMLMAYAREVLVNTEQHVLADAASLC